MERDKRVQALEDELKLMKGELKETLSNVRDFLLSANLAPLAEDDTPDIEPTLVLTSDISGLSPLRPGRQRESEEYEEPEGIEEYEEPEGVKEYEQPGGVKEHEQPEGVEKYEQPERVKKYEQPEEVAEMVKDGLGEPSRAEEPAGHSASQANMLANLIRWVSVAKRELGTEQLPTFLDVYASCGQLSPELRDHILQLAEVIAEQPLGGNVWTGLIRDQLATLLEVHASGGKLSSELNEGILHLCAMMAEPLVGTSIADVWSRLILELHGILAGGASLRPLGALWRDNGDEAQGDTEAGEDRPEDKPMSLKLVLPVDGVEKEFMLNLAPEVSGENGSPSHPDP